MECDSKEQLYKRRKSLKKTRESNFELLRIIAALMIVLFHVMIYWPREQIVNEGLQNYFNNGLFNHPLFYKKLWLINMAMPMGRVGNGLFMMISGFFYQIEMK